MRTTSSTTSKTLLTYTAAIGILVRIGGASATEPAGDWALPTQQDELVKSLTDVAQQYGPDAVIMQAYLLNEAVRNGSVLEAGVSAPSVEEREGKKYLSFILDTGIVFNDRLVSTEDRLVRVWRDIVERTLRRYSSLTVPTEGIAVIVRYHHRGYVDEADLRDHLPAERGEAEVMAFYLLVADAMQLIQKQLVPQELLNRSGVLRDGRPYVLRLP